MTKRQALMKLRTDGQFRICPYDDYMRLVKHLGDKAMYHQIEMKGLRSKITALQHTGLYFIPCADEELTNCFYDPEL